jgi:hypothetical protein
VQTLSAYARLPLSFEPNVGQSDRRVRYVARSAGSSLLLSAREAVLALPGKTAADGRVLRLQFPGADDPVLGASDRLPGKVNYFVGRDRSRWRTGVPTYGRVHYAHMWPGIDASFYGNRSRLEYDLRLAAGADPRRIALRFSGARRESIDSRGGLLLELPGGGQVRELAPVAYQLAEGRRRAVASRFVLSGGVARVALGAYDHRRALTVDPELVYSTYLGGNGFDQGEGVAVDSAGDAYVAGFTTSTDFPNENAERPPGGGVVDAFVSKLNPAGSALIYSTYLGGNRLDFGKDIAVDSAGDAYVTGSTSSTNFPTLSALQPSNGGGEDAFVTKLSSADGALIYSTYLGGSGDDESDGIAIDPGGNAFVAGSTTSPQFPTTLGALQLNDKGLEDAFVTKLNATGSALSYSTYVGGSSYDGANAIAVGADGEAYVTGRSFSADFPTQHPLQPALAGIGDAFVAKLNSTGGALAYSTYLGGSNLDFGSDITIDSAGEAYVTGVTFSASFPTKRPEQPSCGKPCSLGDGFVSKLNSAGDALVYSTYLGGDNEDVGHSVAVDSAGNAYVTGSTSSADFPTSRAAQPKTGGGEDAFLTKFNSADGALIYSTFLGGSGKDEAHGIAVDPAGAAYITGFTESANDFPGKSPLQTAYGGPPSDAFVAKFSSPDIVAPTSAAVSPACDGTVTITVTDNPGGSGGQAVHFRLDGGTDQAIATVGSPSVAATSVPQGNHRLEYWGEDAEGNQELLHHVVLLQRDTLSPALSITGDRGLSSYEIGDHASVTVTARDATSGLAADPSKSHTRIPTKSAGHYKASISATDHCGNSSAASFAYSVIGNPTVAHSVNLETRAGRVTIKLPGSRRGFATLIGARQVPVGTVVDATAGRVALTSATVVRKRLQSAVFAGGRFAVRQRRATRGLVDLRLIDAANGRTCGRSGRASPRTARGSVLVLVGATARGRFRVSGHYASAATRGSGASWSVHDGCAGTLTHVKHGTATVRDFHTKTRKVITAGRRYFVRGR